MHQKGLKMSGALTSICCTSLYVSGVSKISSKHNCVPSGQSSL